jgi:hypothetical protein
VYNADWEPEDTMPTALWVWSGAEQVIGNVERKYMEYTDLIDVLTHAGTLGSFICMVIVYLVNVKD